MSTHPLVSCRRTLIGIEHPCALRQPLGIGDDVERQTWSNSSQRAVSRRHFEAHRHPRHRETSTGHSHDQRLRQLQAGRAVLAITADIEKLLQRGQRGEQIAAIGLNGDGPVQRDVDDGEPANASSMPFGGCGSAMPSSSRGHSTSAVKSGRESASSRRVGSCHRARSAPARRLRDRSRPLPRSAAVCAVDRGLLFPAPQQRMAHRILPRSAGTPRARFPAHRSVAQIPEQRARPVLELTSSSTISTRSRVARSRFESRPRAANRTTV